LPPLALFKDDYFRATASAAAIRHDMRASRATLYAIFADASAIYAAIIDTIRQILPLIALLRRHFDAIIAATLRCRQRLFRLRLRHTAAILMRC